MQKIIFLDQGTCKNQTFNFDFPFTLTNIDNCPAQEVAAQIKGYDIVLTNKVRIDRDAMMQNPQLKLIAVVATGYNIVDTQAAKELGITVCNAPDYSRTSVAEHAFMLMIALMHRLPCYQKRVAQGEWQSSPFFSVFGEPIFDLEGKTIGIVGKGSIGGKLADFAKAFGMTVLFSEHKHAPSVREGYHDFDTVLRAADVYSLHVPLNAATDNMIDEAELAVMKDSAIIINVSRGGLVNEAALAKALKKGVIAGAGIDVTTTEPPTLDHPLLDPTLSNIIVTPHTAWASQEAVARLITIVEQNLNSFMCGGPINVVHIND